MTPKKSYSEAFCKAINEVLQSVDKPIIVLYGDTQIIDLGSLSSFVIDAESFTSTGGDDILTRAGSHRFSHHCQLHLVHQLFHMLSSHM